MAYDNFTAERIRTTLTRAGATFEERRMMGGLCFMVDDKMCCGLLTDKVDGQMLFMARVGETARAELLDRPHVQPMAFTGRPMRGYLFVRGPGFDGDADLEAWVERCLAFNPQAQASKRRQGKADPQA